MAPQSHSGSLENGGADMLLMTGNTRSGGYFGHGCRWPVFSTSSRAVTSAFTRRNREQADSPPTASFHTRSRTATCKPSVFAAYGCRPLIPLTFPQRNFRLRYSTHSGVTCHPTADAKQRGFPPGRHGPRWKPQTQASRPRRDGPLAEIMPPRHPRNRSQRLFERG